MRTIGRFASVNSLLFGGSIVFLLLHFLYSLLQVDISFLEQEMQPELVPLPSVVHLGENERRERERWDWSSQVHSFGHRCFLWSRRWIDHLQLLLNGTHPSCSIQDHAYYWSSLPSLCIRNGEWDQSNGRSITSSFRDSSSRVVEIVRKRLNTRRNSLWMQRVDIYSILYSSLNQWQKSSWLEHVRNYRLFNQEWYSLSVDGGNFIYNYLRFESTRYWDRNAIARQAMAAPVSMKEKRYCSRLGRMKLKLE